MRLVDTVSAYVTEQDPAESVHAAMNGMKLPVELLVVKVTSPDGEEPFTVAVHVVNLPTVVEDGEHVTEREVEALTLRVNTADEEDAPCGEPVMVSM